MVGIIYLVSNFFIFNITYELSKFLHPNSAQTFFNEYFPCLTFSLIHVLLLILIILKDVKKKFTFLSLCGFDYDERKLRFLSTSLL